MRPTRTAPLAASAAVLLLATLAACGGSEHSTSAGSAASRIGAEDMGGGGVPKPDKVDPGSSGGQTAPSTSARVIPVDRSIVYHGEITVRVRDVAAATDRAESLTSAAEGLVFAEETSTDGRGGKPTRATLTLRVPPSQFRPVLDRLGALGRTVSRSQNAQDVTSQVVDVDSRLRSQRRSVARLQALLDQANTIGAIVQVEGELSRRESDLEALEAQQKKLDDLTDMATVDVTLLAPRAKAPVVVEDDKHLGFVSGLRNGWTALAAVALVTLTIAGALLPFAIAVALLGLPAWWVWRARRQHPALPAGSDG